MVTAAAPHTKSALQILEDDHLSGLDRGVDRLDPRREAIDLWSAALARGDHAEVDRLVRQSRIDRVWVAASGQLGTMLG